MLQAVSWKSPALEDPPLLPDRLQSLDMGKTENLLWPQDHILPTQLTMRLTWHFPGSKVMYFLDPHSTIMGLDLAELQ